MIENPNRNSQRAVNRRSLLKGGMLAGGAALATAGLLATGAPSAFGEESERHEPLTRGDVAILRFLAAAELIEADLWNQYAELGGVTDGTQNNYQLAFQYLDGDGSQYITSNTLDENTHADFLNKYLEMKGAEPVDLDPFRRLPGSTASGSSGAARLTNLMNLNVDTSWYIRYRSSTNPDFGATYPQAITIRNRPAIPRNDNDFDDEDHIQAIANTAAFHFASIEQGGSSLYPALGQKVTNSEVLRIIFGIGGDEVAHFLEWVTSPGTPSRDLHLISTTSRLLLRITASPSRISTIHPIHCCRPTLSSRSLANSSVQNFQRSRCSVRLRTSLPERRPRSPSSKGKDYLKGRETTSFNS
jgi:hypothetical protein